jgi:hypothetical protein
MMGFCLCMYVVDCINDEQVHHIETAKLLVDYTLTYEVGETPVTLS